METRGKGEYIFKVYITFFLHRQCDTNTKISITVLLATAIAYSSEINCRATDSQVDIYNLDT